MADFYTITLRRQQIVTSYDAKGKPTGTTIAHLEEKHSGLPASTVAAYQRQFPGAVVAVTREVADYVQPKSRATTVRHRERPVTHTRLDGRQRPTSSRETASPAPITGGTYADAITKASRREAAA